MIDVHYWAVIPAAGTGARMGSDLPKQYLSLAGKTVLEWALAPFLADARCQGVVISLADSDLHWSSLAVSRDARVHRTAGGRERVDSVLAGLKALRQQGAETNDWVLVHDAARPCLSAADIEQLLQVTEEESVGALLATPVADTLKRAAPDGRVLQTVPRDALWRAQTPQMFRLSLLQGALQDALAQGRTVTDEAAAVESLGLMPRLVRGHTNNLKITLPEDLALAAQILAARTEAGS